MVYISLTTLDTDLRNVMETRTSPPAARLAAIAALAQAGIPTGALIAPVIPGLTDHELPRLVRAAAEAGARFAGFTMLRLPHAVAPLFKKWLKEHFPSKVEKVLGRIRAIRDGTLNDSRFGNRMRGEDLFADNLHELFTVACHKAGLSTDALELSATAFRRAGAEQLPLLSDL